MISKRDREQRSRRFKAKAVPLEPMAKLATLVPGEAMIAVHKVNGVASAGSTLGIDCATTTSAAEDRSSTLLILSDIRFLRDGLAEVLARDGAFAVVGAAAGLEEALEITR